MESPTLRPLLKQDVSRAWSCTENEGTKKALDGHPRGRLRFGKCWNDIGKEV
jgi:hypothetical protein